MHVVLAKFFSERQVIIPYIKRTIIGGNKMKRLLCLALAGVLTLCTIGCGQTPPNTSKEKVTIEYSNESDDDSIVFDVTTESEADTSSQEEQPTDIFSDCFAGIEVGNIPGLTFAGKNMDEVLSEANNILAPMYDKQVQYEDYNGYRYHYTSSTGAKNSAGVYNPDFGANVESTKKSGKELTTAGNMTEFPLTSDEIRKLENYDSDTADEEFYYEDLLNYTGTAGLVMGLHEKATGELSISMTWKASDNYTWSVGLDGSTGKVLSVSSYAPPVL